jgi:uncharacterized protein YutE (UPF0331/DUF86 family)
MNSPHHQDVLHESLHQMDQALKWLEHSYAQCKQFSSNKTFSTAEYDALESLASRFARASDIIFQKVFRSIDIMELEEGGTLLDVLNRAEKKGLIESVEKVRLLRELRNKIAHEYVHDELLEIFKKVFEQTPVLFDISNNTQKYCKKFTTN